MKKYLKYIMYIIFFVLAVFLLYVFAVLYEEVKVRETVETIFENNNYEDISLIVCHEEKCLYDFGKGREHVDIYTVGRDNIEFRIELAREVAKAWPNKNHLCKTYGQDRCQHLKCLTRNPRKIY